VLNINADQDVTINPDGMSTCGTISHGGILNGTTADVFMSPPVPVANTDTLALTDTLTITANHGTLTCSDVTLFNPTHGLFTTISTINRLRNFQRSNWHPVRFRDKRERRALPRQNYGSSYDLPPIARALKSRESRYRQMR
jgi:hypothetical protein